MQIPGFNAEASLYKTTVNYHGTISQAAGISGVTLSASCTCTDPGCTWSCPQADPCLKFCSRLSGCARQRCICICNGGAPEPTGNPNIPCHFVCT
jgi:hypothetical protein